jgi:hypothetical protein
MVEFESKCLLSCFINRINMGIKDKLRKFVTGESKEETVVEEKEETKPAAQGRECSFCNQPGADKKFGGSYWHKKCLRNTRKFAKRMV